MSFQLGQLLTCSLSCATISAIALLSLNRRIMGSVVRDMVAALAEVSVVVPSVDFARFWRPNAGRAISAPLLFVGSVAKSADE